MALKVVLVCGGRKFTKRQHLNATLDAVRAHYGDLFIVHGGAVGADLMAHSWATDHGLHAARVEALWGFHGKSAGPIRNSAMLTLQPSLCIAFEGGVGTADMVKKAKAAGIETYEV
jgi:hypothetical protein